MTTPKGAAARARMLDATIGLMRRGGLARAGVNEIVAASGTPKGSVYHFFPGGKRQIAVEALERYAGNVHASMDETMSHVHGPRAKIRALFALVARRLEDADFGASCAVGAVTLDLDADLESVRPAAASAFAAWRALIERHIDIPDRKRREAFAGLVLTAIQGGYVRGRAERSVEPFHEAARWLGDIAEREAGHAQDRPHSGRSR